MAEAPCLTQTYSSPEFSVSKTPSVLLDDLITRQGVLVRCKKEALVDLVAMNGKDAVAKMIGTQVLLALGSDGEPKIADGD